MRKCGACAWATTSSTMRTFESLRVNELMACADVVVLVNHKTFGEKREFPPFPLSITSRGLIYSKRGGPADIFRPEGKLVIPLEQFVAG